MADDVPLLAPGGQRPGDREDDHRREVQDAEKARGL
jgi:hypothetical protein